MICTIQTRIEAYTGRGGGNKTARQILTSSASLIIAAIAPNRLNPRVTGAVAINHLCTKDRMTKVASQIKPRVTNFIVALFARK
jgi:hypothetical protein